mmetsp:Transcript_31364/g.37330  ORF Transcript_31364/g.37330 Transcript_31364/m.37330 type:complete len:111 (-) Transcript_31364:274-606(-)
MNLLMRMGGSVRVPFWFGGGLFTVEVALFFGLVLIVRLVDTVDHAVFEVVVLLALEKRVGVDACGSDACSCTCAGLRTCAILCASGVVWVVYVSQGVGIVLWMVVVGDGG